MLGVIALQYRPDAVEKITSSPSGALLPAASMKVADRDALEPSAPLYATGHPVMIGAGRLQGTTHDTVDTADRLEVRPRRPPLAIACTAKRVLYVTQHAGDKH
jgi:hypothetical protein